MRAIMNRAELARYHVKDAGRDYSKSDDGYGDMEVNESEGWETISGWGEDGWDMGNWPYVMLSKRWTTDKNLFEVLSVCEGDHSYYSFATIEDAYAALDYLFAWYSPEIVGIDRAILDEGGIEPDPKFREPYTSKRAFAGDRTNVEVDGVVVASSKHVEL
jgi:hypothetical protein